MPLLDFDSVWPCFAEVALLLQLASTRPFAAADAPPGQTTGRLRSLDGLRGFLALAVFFDHGATYHQFLNNGQWYTPSTFYNLIGLVGVALFFAVTGFLFWDRLIREGGRPIWRDLYIGRVFRIAPVYLLTVLLLLGIVALATGEKRSTGPELLGQISTWLTLGVLRRYPDINGFPDTYLLQAGTIWSLRYEWAYYALLPVMALALRLRLALGAPVMLLILALMWCAYDPHYWHTDLVPIPAFAALFAGGMITAALLRSGRMPPIPPVLASGLVPALIGATILYGEVYAPVPLLLLIATFLLVASGCDVFGLLTLKAARRLGDVSYGLYLMHGLVLSAVLRPLREFALSSPAAHWALLMVCAGISVCLATAAHRWVELPGITAGRRVSAFLAGLQRGASQRAGG